MANRTTGAWLIGAALVLAVAAWGLWAWANSDSGMYDREVDALSHSMSTGEPYKQPEPNAAPSLILGGVAGVLFLGGIVLIATNPVSPTRDEPSASDRP